jgi:hypothetical protein
MSVGVRLTTLRTALAERGNTAYLLTVADDGRPHTVHLAVRWEDDTLVVEVGRRSAANAAARPMVSLLCPVRSAGDYSLIIDGTAEADGTVDPPRLRITPTRAVLHRPTATPDPASACGADCVPLLDAPGVGEPPPR